MKALITKLCALLASLGLPFAHAAEASKEKQAQVAEHEAVESIALKMVHEFASVAIAWSDVKTAEDAKVAANKIEGIKTNLDTLITELEKQKVPTDSQKKVINEKMNKLFTKQVGDKPSEMEQLKKNSEIEPILSKAMLSFNEYMKKTGPRVNKYFQETHNAST